MNQIPSFYSGTSNIVLPIKQSQFSGEFKNATRLTYYASLFSSLEVNASFYKTPKPATVEKWRESVPEDFKFTFKLPKAVTHTKNLQFSAGELEKFTEAVAGAANKKGCLLVQLPPSVKRDKREELEGILEYLRSDAKGWHVAVEFRDVSWYHAEIYSVLQSIGVGIVEHDMPTSATPRTKLDHNFHYLRFHGPEGTYRGSYNDDHLLAQAKRIATWLKEGNEVFAYFNNTMGNAVSNLVSLNNLVKHQLSKNALSRQKK